MFMFLVRCTLSPSFSFSSSVRFYVTFISMSGGIWNSFWSKLRKKGASPDKSSEPQGQEQYKVNKQHNYDEVDLDQASREPNWDVEKKPRNYDQVDIGGNQSEQSKE
ncbi:uncharacterized protein LOC132565107 isoform X2 [Ylistrum balloti]|uniref:uncharacterized protein LOC132565107 isoform X2 n=1 Tax=Ylistrum balloti TaxID=509963 RepID=UPI002905DD94|nr:uncharacterized protein LOC132565107 isoform X2 [Ylistrum balloti]